MELFMDLFMGSVFISIGIVFLRFSSRIAAAFDESGTVFWKSLNLFKVSSRKSIIPTRMLIVVSGFGFLSFGILCVLMFISSIISKR